MSHRGHFVERLVQALDISHGQGGGTRGVWRRHRSCLVLGPSGLWHPNWGGRSPRPTWVHTSYQTHREDTCSRGDWLQTPSLPRHSQFPGEAQAVPVMAGWADKVPRLKSDQPRPRRAGTWTPGFLTDRTIAHPSREASPGNTGRGARGSHPGNRLCTDYVLGWHAPLA